MKVFVQHTKVLALHTVEMVIAQVFGVYVDVGSCVQTFDMLLGQQRVGSYYTHLLTLHRMVGLSQEQTNRPHSSLQSSHLHLQRFVLSTFLLRMSMTSVTTLVSLLTDNNDVN